MRIRKCLAVVGVMCTVILGACGGERKSGFDRDERMQLRQVQEWADAVNILHREDMEIMHFGRGKKGMYVQYLAGGSELFENFGEMILASNEFLKEHPGYLLTDGYSVEIRCEGQTETDYEYIISNRLIETEFDVSGIEFEVEDTTDLQYFYMLRDRAFPENWTNIEHKLETTVLLIERERDIRDQKTFDVSFLQTFVGLKYIVINVDKPETDDYTVLKERVEEQVPDCEVYVIHEGESLTKNE